MGHHVITRGHSGTIGSAMEQVRQLWKHKVDFIQMAMQYANSISMFHILLFNVQTWQCNMQMYIQYSLFCQFSYKIDHWIARDWILNCHFHIALSIDKQDWTLNSKRLTIELPIAHCIDIWILTPKMHGKPPYCYPIWLSVIQSIIIQSLWILNWRLKRDISHWTVK